MYFEVVWTSGGLLWISAVLSTVRPLTSPRLSVIQLASPHLTTIQLNFVRRPTDNESVEDIIKHTGNDLRKVADEVARIKREFRGASGLTVLRDPAFEMVLARFNVRLHSCRAGGLAKTADSVLFVPCRSIGIEIVGTESSAEPFNWSVWGVESPGLWTLTHSNFRIPDTSNRRHNTQPGKL